MSINATARGAVPAPSTIDVHRDSAISTYLHGGHGSYAVEIDEDVIVGFEDDIEAERYADDLRAIRRALTERHELVEGLHDLADFLETHPDAPADTAWCMTWAHSTTPESFRAAADALRPIGFELDRTRSEYVKISHKFGRLSYEVEMSAAKVCEERTLTKTITEHVLPEWAQPPAAKNDEQAAAAAGGAL